MKSRMTLATALLVIKYGVTPIACWPLPPNASPSNVLRHNLYWWFAIIHIFVSSTAWAYNIYKNRNDADIVIRCAAELCAILAVPVKMIICKIKAPDIERLLTEMKLFVKQATSEEMKLIQSYIDKYLFYHGIVFVICIVAPVTYIFGPVVLAQPLPGDVAYPFSLEPLWIYMMLYISHSLIIFQAGSMAILDLMFAVLLWYTGVRFEILCVALEQAANADEVAYCVQKHQEMLGQVEKLKLSVGPVAFALAIMAVFAIATGGFLLIRVRSTFENPPAFVMLKLVCFDVIATMELFLYAWPADNLKEMSSRIGNAAYSCDWIGKSPKMTKNLLIIMQRSQIPSVVDFRGVLPALSLQLYGSAMYTSFSYLTTLLAMTAN